MSDHWKAAASCCLRFRALLRVLILFGACAASGRAVAQDDAVELPDRVRQHPRPGIVNYYRPGVWSTQTVDLENQSGEPKEVVTGGYFRGSPLNRYARQVTLPPRSMRRVTIPVLPVADEDNRILWHPMLYDANDSSGALMRATDIYMIDSEYLQQPAEPVTVSLSDHTDSNRERWRSLSEFAVTARLQQERTRRQVEMGAPDVPVIPGGLDVVDQVFLGSNGIAEYPARLAVLRNWLEQGGHMWIRLDYVRPETVRQLLGDSVSLVTVDRCSLSSVQMSSEGQSIGPRLEFDYPVEMVRVIVDRNAVDVVLTVDGWPAAFVATVGRGRVAFSTLGDRAWMHERNETPIDLERYSKFAANLAYSQALDEWTKSTDPPPLQPTDFEPMLAAQVAYEIPGRGIILSVLGMFCCSLVAAGWWLHRSSVPEFGEPEAGDAQPGRRLERLAVVGPILALLAAAPIIFLGQASRSDVPASLSLAEFVEVSPAVSALNSTGSISVFAPDTAEVDLQGSAGRILLPERERLAGTLRQMTRANFSETYWDRLQVNAGLQFLQTTQSQEISESIRALAAFGPNGVTGTLSPGPYRDPQDVMIAGAAPNVLPVEVSEGGRFTAEADAVLAPGVYLPGTVLTDEQIRRQSVYRRLLTAKSDSCYPRRPVLLAWMESLQKGLNTPEGYQDNDRSLLAIPVEFERTPPGTDITIPAPFLSAEDVLTSSGGRSTVYSNRTCQWREGQQPGTTLLRYRLPDSVKPLQLTQVRLEFSILAPSRTITIAVGAKDQLTEAITLTDAAGTYDFTLTEPDQLRLDADGNYFVEVAVRASREAEEAGLPNQIWQMDYVRLDVSGRTLDPDAVQSTTEDTADE